MAKRKPLTDRQAEILLYVRAYRKEYGLAPSLLEIAKRFKVHLRAIQDHLRLIEQKGYVKRYKGIARGLVVLK